MKIFNKLSLKIKLLILFTTVVLVIASGLIFGISTLQKNHESYIYLLNYPVQRMECYGEAKYAVMGMRKAHLTFYLYDADIEIIKQLYNESTHFAYNAIQHLEMCRNNIKEDSMLDNETKINYDNGIQSTIQRINNYMDSYIIPAYNIVLQKEDLTAFTKKYVEEGKAEGNLIIQDLDRMFQSAKISLQETSEVALNSANNLMVAMIIIFVIILFVIICLFFIIAYEISIPIKHFIAKIIKIDYTNLDAEGKKEISNLIKYIIG